jgi:hypothetical protein
MTTLWQVPAAVVALLVWLTIPPTSLADAARREAVRRAATPAPVAVLSNQNLPPDWVVSPSSRPAAATEPQAAVAVDASEAVDSPAAAPASVTSEAAGSQPAPGATVPAGREAAVGAAAAGPAPASPASAPAKAARAGDDEQSWRNQMSTLRAALAADQAKAASLQTRINGLQTDFINRDDPGQKSVLEQQLQQALSDLDKARAQVQTDTAAIQALRDEARRAGVPAGWTR